jgi:hypothetical protein
VLRPVACVKDFLRAVWFISWVYLGLPDPMRPRQYRFVTEVAWN